MGLSLGEQLLEEALLLGLVVLGALWPGALLGGRGSDGALVQVGVTADQVHCTLDVREHLNLLHLQGRQRYKLQIALFILEPRLEPDRLWMFFFYLIFFS